MYRPDRVILRKIQEYDPYLFVEWNPRRKFFEIWRHMPHGRRLITPITKSIYAWDAGLEFTTLDERFLWWLYEADGWNKRDGHRAHHLEQDRRFMEFHKTKDARMREHWRGIGREMWHTMNNRFVTTHQTKNSGLPTWNKTSPNGQWVRPDVQVRTSQRLFQRSSKYAKLYGYRGKG